jgi:hypothetical protein
MELPQRGFAEAAIELMGRVCDEAWSEVQTAVLPSPQDGEEMLRQMIVRVNGRCCRGA